MSSVAFLTYDFSNIGKPEPNGCAWYRCFLPMLELRKRGWDAAMGTPGWNDEMGFGLAMPEGGVHGWDVLVFKLIMSKEIADKMPIAQAMGQTIVVDLDDFHDGIHDTNYAKSQIDPKRNPDYNIDHYNRIIDQADALITSTPFLYDHYLAQGKRVYMVRNGIDYERWTPRKDHAGWMPTIGWVGATPWRSQDLETLPWFADFVKQHRLPFHHSGYIKGATGAAEIFGVQGSKSPMQPISNYPSLFKKIDIGIVPLRDTPFNHAKSTIKGLEYAAAGVPFVASYSPEYALLAEQGIGRVAHNDDEWIMHMEALLNPHTRIAEGQANRAALSEYGMDRRGYEWDAVFNLIINALHTPTTTTHIQREDALI